MGKTIVRETRSGDPFAFTGERVASDRERRAIALYIERGHEIVQVAPNLYWVPSQDGQREHLVSYPVQPGESESCSCPDSTFRRATCVHVYAVALRYAKRAAQRRKNFIHGLAATEEEEEEA